MIIKTVFLASFRRKTMKKSSDKKSSDNNFLTVKRIEEIMSEHGYEKYKDGKDFAYEIDVLPQNFSRFMTSGKVSPYYCKKIIKAFPNRHNEVLSKINGFRTTLIIMREKFITNRLEKIY